MNGLKENIKKKDFKTVYLLSGEELYLRAHYEKLLIRELLNGGDEVMNVNIFEEQSLNAARITEACDVLPFMADKRVVLVRDSKFFKAGKKNDADILTQYIPKLPETTTLIFTETEIDKRGALYKAVAKYGLAAEFVTPAEKELVEWTRNIFAKTKVKIDTGTLLYFLRCIDLNLNNIISEANKLIAYVTGGVAAQGGGVTTAASTAVSAPRPVTVADIDLLTSKTLEAKIFEMVDCIGGKNAERALLIYNNLIFLKEQPIAILAMVARQFRILLQVKSLSGEGCSPPVIAQKTALRSFIVDSALRQAKNFSLEILRAAVKLCLETDAAIKSGKINGETGVMLIIAEYSGKK